MKEAMSLPLQDDDSIKLTPRPAEYFCLRPPLKG